jgi:hypothetical protein
MDFHPDSHDRHRWDRVNIEIDKQAERHARTLVNRHQPPINLENLHFTCYGFEGGIAVESMEVVDGIEQFGVRTKDDSLPITRQ